MNLERFSDPFSISVLLEVHKMPFSTKERPFSSSLQSLLDVVPGIHEPNTNVYSGSCKIPGNGEAICPAQDKQGGFFFLFKTYFCSKTIKINVNASTYIK